jgi:phosphate/sulfate permease
MIMIESIRTETKTKAASWAAFALSLAALTLLGTVSTDYVHALPDWAEVPAYSLLGTAVIWLTAFNTKHKPASLSPSAVEALRGKYHLVPHPTGRVSSDLNPTGEDRFA